MPLAKDSYIEIALHGREKSLPSATQFLLDQQIPFQDLAASEHHGRFKLSFFTRSNIQVRKIRGKLSDSKLSGLKLTAKILGKADWRDKWMLTYHQTPVGKSFLIVPAWEKMSRMKTKRIPIFLNPGCAFGSGTHETTKLILRLMEFAVEPQISFLDLGTGTGVLAVGAYKLGAKKILAIDHDRSSIPYARKNYALNQCKNGKIICRDLKHLKNKTTFNFVAANLTSKVLLAYKTTILSVMANNSYLAMTGILLRDLKPFQAEIHSPNLRCVKILKGRRWVALLYKKSA